MFYKRFLYNLLFLINLLILNIEKLLILRFIKDRNKTDSHRFKPSSRKTLIDEQSNHSNLLQLEDVLSRHRGDNRKLCYERSTFIILLSL